jgi:hypothetical protein
MVRLLLFLVGTLTANRPRQWEAARYRAGDSYVGEEPVTLHPEPGNSAGGALPPHHSRHGLVRRGTARDLTAAESPAG